MQSAPADLARPSDRQLAWHQLEMFGFIHFTINTFTDREWGYGDESPERFNPARLDCDQWVAAAKAGGLGGLILTAKHHDGFCLWPTRTTKHNITASPFRDGRGDVVRELADACERGGIKFGLYCSPWDRNHAEYARDAYVETYHEQWRELVTQYGPLFEIWLDGANGGDGYYGGARETRSIDPKAYYRFDELHDLFRRHQPDAVIHGGGNADVRWCGNELGFATFTNWSTVADLNHLPQGERDLASIQGQPAGPIWRPAEVDVSMRPGWFWHPKERPHTPQALFDVYLASVGRGAGLLLNLTPDRDGLIPTEDVATLYEFSQMIDRFTLIDLAQDRQAATPDDQTETVVELGKAYPIVGVRIEEDIRHGQRVAEWSLEVRACRSWFEIARGTTIGPQRIIPLHAALGNAVRLRITDAIAPPKLHRIKVFAGTDRKH